MKDVTVAYDVTSSYQVTVSLPDDFDPTKDGSFKRLREAILNKAEDDPESVEHLGTYRPENLEIIEDAPRG